MKTLPLQLWIDSDPSGFYYSGLDCDDDLAILIAIALHQKQLIKLEGLSICGGNAPVRHTWDNALRLWKFVDGYQRTSFEPVKGYGWRSMQVAVKLMSLYNALFPDDPDVDDAVLAIVKRAKDLSHLQQKSLTILSLGPPTNVAKAIQAVGADSNDIRHIYLMGGELTNQQLDLNFRSDRESTRIIIEANIPKTIIPIQTCGQISIAEEWINSLNCDTNNKLAVCAYVSKMKQQVLLMPMFVNTAVKEKMSSSSNETYHDWVASPNLDRGFIPWDIVALLAITHPEEFTDWRYHQISLTICDSGEPCDGTMQVLNDFGGSFNGKNWSNVVRIPHRIRNETRLLGIMMKLLHEVELTASTRQPHLSWGFVTSYTGFCIATSVFVLCCIRLYLRKR